MKPVPACLSDQHTSRLKKSLARWHANRGPVLLGSQLGQLIGEVIQPLTIRSCGGLKALADRDLREIVNSIREQNSSDIRYRILVSPDPSLPAAQSSGTFDQEQEIAGVDIWRIFANPRIVCQLAASPNGEIVVAPTEHALSSGKNLLRKLTSEDYRLLAGQFTATWIDPSARERMQSALQLDEFYNSWIESLRRSRTTEFNPLKQWEITRAEHVARKLGEELVAAGVDSARAAEIVATARPSTSPRAPRVAVPIEPTRSACAKLPDSARASRSVADDTRWMREVLHLAIDKMPLSELLEIRVPAGLLLEISRQQRA